MPCWRRCAAISTTSPNQAGVERTDSAEVWICTDPSAILVIYASLREWKWFFSLKEAHFYPGLLQLNSSLRNSWAEGRSPPPFPPHGFQSQSQPVDACTDLWRT